MRILAILAVTAAIAGCSTTTPAERMALHQTTCEGYGFRPNTDAYSTCMMQMDMSAKAEDRRRTAAIGAALSGMGQAMQPPRRVTCNTRSNAQRFGSGAYGNSTTTCY